MGKRKDAVIKEEPTHRNGKPVVFRISWGVRKYIIKRDGFICRYCDVTLDYDTHTIDHIVPCSKGGTEHPDNLAMCCGPCNKRAKDLLFESFEAKREHLKELKRLAKISEAKRRRK